MKTMKNVSFALCCLGMGLFLSSPVFSQNQTPPNTTNNNNQGGESDGIAGFWEIECVQGKFLARLDQITSISLHEYLIDGAVKVLECTVDTSGNMTGRFYHIEPVGASNSVISSSGIQDRLKTLTNTVTSKAGVGDFEHIVTKNYPTTTHSKTAEFRFKNKANIGQIYAHARRVWAEERGRGRANKLTVVEK